MKTIKNIKKLVMVKHKTSGLVSKVIGSTDFHLWILNSTDKISMVDVEEVMRDYELIYQQQDDGGVVCQTKTTT